MNEKCLVQNRQDVQRRHFVQQNMNKLLVHALFLALKSLPKIRFYVFYDTATSICAKKKQRLRRTVLADMKKCEDYNYHHAFVAQNGVAMIHGKCVCE